MERVVLDAQRAHISRVPQCHCTTKPLGGTGTSLALKEMMMTPKFLREEAARFRGMAGIADLEASKTRLLAMAIDFESRASATEELITSKLDEGIEDDKGIKDRAKKKITKDLHNSV
jgi:hypothetical protein